MNNKIVKIDKEKIAEKKKCYKLFIIFVFCLSFIMMNFKFFNVDLFKSMIKGNKIFKGRIFLCVLYNNEAEFAYIYIWRLYDYIDKFIIVTSNFTYSGLPKKLTFEPFEENIYQYKDKLDIVFFDNNCNRSEYPNSDLIWCIEMSQRDYAKNHLEKHYNLTENDLIILTDLDEILTREGIEYIKKNPPDEFYFLKGAIYFPYYYHKLQDWDRSVVIRYSKKMKTLTKYRSGRPANNNTLKYLKNPSKPLITHCSYCFKGFEDYRNKLKSFSHKEFNKEPFITNDWIFKSHFCREKINSPSNVYDEPYEGWKNLIPDDNRLKYLVDRSFMYPLNETNYTEKDLETLCNKTYNRTPFEPSATYQFYKQ